MNRLHAKGLLASALLGLLLLLLLPLPVAAQLDRPLNRYFEPCAGATSNDEARDCLGQQYRRVDEELNAVWPHVLRLIDSSDKRPAETRRQWRDDIVAAQRAWVQYKEAECLRSAPAKFHDSAQAEIERVGCLLRLTALRLDELKDYLHFRP